MVVGMEWTSMDKDCCHLGHGDRESTLTQTSRLHECPTAK